jgi:uncharacterized protein
MNPIAPDSPEADLARLERVVRAIAGFDDAVDMEWVDGYLTGLAATGRPLRREDWLPAMFDGSFERAFADPPSVEEAAGALEARLGILRRQLDAECLLEWPDRIRLNPWLGEFDDAAREDARAAGADDDALYFLQPGGGWAAGFCDAVDVHPEWWPEPADGPEALMLEDLWAPIDLLGIPPSEPERAGFVARHFPEGEPDRDSLIAEALLSVQELRVWQVDHAPVPETVRVAKLPGRNEPCWCGSGKKFKKCHGA